MTRWLPFIAVVIVASAVGWWWYRPAIPFVNPAHEQRGTANEQEVEQKDAAIRGLSTKITELRALADREAQARRLAEQKAGTFADRARALTLEVQRLEATAKTVLPIESRLRALERLKALGYR